MTLWGCQLGAGFLNCASTSYTVLQMGIVVVVTVAVASALLFFGARCVGSA